MCRLSLLIVVLGVEEARRCLFFSMLRRLVQEWRVDRIYFCFLQFLLVLGEEKSWVFWGRLSSRLCPQSSELRPPPERQICVFKKKKKILMFFPSLPCSLYCIWEKKRWVNYKQTNSIILISSLLTTNFFSPQHPPFFFLE